MEKKRNEVNNGGKKTQMKKKEIKAGWTPPMTSSWMDGWSMNRYPGVMLSRSEGCGRRTGFSMPLTHLSSAQ